MTITFTGKSFETGERICGEGFKTVNENPFILKDGEWLQIIDGTLRINYPSGLEEYPDSNISEDELDDLHERLVRTAINFCLENRFEQIDEIGFSVDGLQESMYTGTWSAGTDSSLQVVGWHDNKRKLIGYRI